METQEPQKQCELQEFFKREQEGSGAGTGGGTQTEQDGGGEGREP